MDVWYKITDKTNGNSVYVTKHDVKEIMSGWYDAPDADSVQAVADAIDNVEDWMYGRLNGETFWAPDFLNVDIRYVEDEDERTMYSVSVGYGQTGIEDICFQERLRTQDAYEARRLFEQLADREDMRKAWDVEYSCGNRIRKSLVYGVAIDEYIERWDEDAEDWTIWQDVNYDAVYYGIEDYRADEE